MLNRVKVKTDIFKTNQLKDLMKEVIRDLKKE